MQGLLRKVFVFLATISATTLGLHANWKRITKLCKASMAPLVITLTLQEPAHSITDAPALERFEATKKVLVDLDKNWDTVVQGQGDNIRRKLGTVYTPPICDSPLCGFPKFVNQFVQAHPDDLDIAAFEEPVSEFQQAINQADYLAYSSVFSEYGNGGGGVNYLESSHAQILKAIRAIEEVLSVVHEP